MTYLPISRIRWSVLLLIALAFGNLANAATNPLPFFPPAPQTVSTVPTNGDTNPYGAAFVPLTVPHNSGLEPGDLLISNFNNSAPTSGLGSTIVRIRNGVESLFFTSSSPAGWSGGLVVLSNGIVVGGGLPTTDGTYSTVQPGGLFFISPAGTLLQELTGGNVDGPWGIALYQDRPDRANLFVSNVISGKVVRYDLSLGFNPPSFQILDQVIIASGFSQANGGAAVILGVSGLAYSPWNDTLYIASSNDDIIYALSGARQTSSTLPFPPAFISDSNLRGPVVLVLAPNGDLLVSNSDGNNANPTFPSEIVQYASDGAFITEYSVDPNEGGAFGIALIQAGNAFAFAAVDDNTNMVTVWNTILFNQESEHRGFGGFDGFF
jgi:hypothetical protein